MYFNTHPVPRFHNSTLPSVFPTRTLLSKVGMLQTTPESPSIAGLSHERGDTRVVKCSYVADFHTSRRLEQHPTIHDPKMNSCRTDSFIPAGISSSSIFLALLKTHIPPLSSVSLPPHAANSRSLKANIAVMTSGVWGLVIKVRFNPLRRSYVCKHRPTEVVIWKVDLPSGTEVNGTLLEETSPKVCQGSDKLLQESCNV